MNSYFSVVTPSFNQGTFIGPCLQSVVDQADPDYEHLVFDNCSTDTTASEVARFPQVRFISEPDRGQSDAINKGFAAAQGEILCWLNSDDAYPPGVFARLREIFADPTVEVVFGDALQATYDGRGDVRAPARFDSRLDLIRWWSPEVKIHQPAVFFRRTTARQAGPLREDLHYVMDYEYWWRLSEHSPFRYLPEILAIQHRQPDSKTIRHWHKVYAERERVFAPYYGLIDGGDRRALLREKRNVMARRFLGEAFAAAPSSRAFAWQCLLRAFGERPLLLLDPAWLGVLRRMAAR